MKKLILVIVLSVFIPSCAVNPVTGERELMFLTEGMEIELGHSVFPNALWGEVGGGGKYRDPELESYLTDIVRKLHSVSHRPNLPVRFVIQNSSVPNAWAIPGYVSMTRGLLAGLDNEAQFAFIMGHEMGHVAARHSAAQVSRNLLVLFGLSALGVALKDQKLSELVLGAGAIGSSLFLLKYSRDQEFQADRLGALYMAKAGYDPYEAIVSLQKLDYISKDYLQRMGKGTRESSFIEELLSTHPPMKDRMNHLHSHIPTVVPYDRRGDGKEFYTFQRVTSKLKHTQMAYIHYDRALKAFKEDRLWEAERQLDTAFQSSVNQAPFYNLKGLIEVKKGNLYHAEAQFRRALEIDPEYQPAFHGMGFIYYLNTNYSYAFSLFKESLTLYPQNLPSHYFAGMSLYKMRRYKEAIPHLEAFSSAHTEHPEIFGITGICYDSIGNLESAYLSYKRQLEIAPLNKLGQHAGQRIKTIEPILKEQKALQKEREKKRR